VKWKKTIMSKGIYLKNGVRRRDSFSRKIQNDSIYIYTEEVYNEIAALIANANDAAVTFVPRDPASQEGDERGWTLGHVIARLTASCMATVVWGWRLLRASFVPTVAR
jgi:hypothetical protein